MGLIENDPRDTAYVALYIAIKWYQEISSDAAIRIAYGQSNRKPGNKLTPEILEEIKKIIASPNFSNINSIVRQYRVNKYDVFEALEKDKVETTGEEVIIVPKIEFELKRLSKKANDCPGANCDTCVLNSLVFGENTFCEILCDLEFDAQGKLTQEKVIPKSYRSHTVEDLSGEIIRKTYKLHKRADEEIHQYAKKNQKKLQDVISLALMEYAERHKK